MNQFAVAKLLSVLKTAHFSAVPCEDRTFIFPHSFRLIIRCVTHQEIWS